MRKTVQEHMQATRQRLAEAAATRQAKSKSGSMPPKNVKSPSHKPQGNVPKNVRPTGKGK